MNLSNKIVILHQAALQGHIWQKVLQSQGLQATILPFSADLQGELSALQKDQQPLPSLILLEQQLPTFDTAQFCQWLQTLDQPIPILLIAPQSRKVETADREAAIALGAVDLLPQFDLNSIAIEAVSGLKTVAKVLGNLNVVNSTLVTCIMDLKRELEDIQKASTTSPITPTPTTPPKVRPIPPATVQPTTAMPPQKARKYRGRDY
ncbi:response regulator [Synechococcus moorigangaii CMS01]|nr:response regulator [Synechococcus moorigangaii CMS01]